MYKVFQILKIDFCLYQVLAFIILNMQIDIKMFNDYIVLNNWRVFMIACAVPSVLTAFLFMILPESPKFCLYVSLKRIFYSSVKFKN
jgi:hypothetical protein